MGQPVAARPSAPLAAAPVDPASRPVTKDSQAAHQFVAPMPVASIAHRRAMLRTTQTQRSERSAKASSDVLLHVTFFRIAALNRLQRHHKPVASQATLVVLC
jgi:hypothetical protein